MKKILLATTVLVGTAGFAAAEVTLSGDGRMGVVSNDGAVSFSSRARVKFTLAGTTDNGLEFGGSFRANNANTDGYSCSDDDGDGTMDDSECAAFSGGADDGTAGSVFIKGGFGTLTMGDIDSAANNAVGQIAGVGYTGLGTLNEIAYVGSGDDEGLLYEYSASGFTGYLSVGQPSNGDDTASVGVKYATDGFTVGLGMDASAAGDQYAGSVSTTVAGVSLTALASQTEYGDDVTGNAIGMSASYTMGATTFTAYSLGSSIAQDSTGVGASYDLGGGAALSAGLVHTNIARPEPTRRGTQTDDILADVGVSFSF